MVYGYNVLCTYMFDNRYLNVRKITQTTNLKKNIKGKTQYLFKFFIHCIHYNTKFLLEI